MLFKGGGIMKKAYVVGIDEYLNHPLSGCVNDANVVSELLSHNADGSPNFDVKKGINLKKKFELVNGIKDLFSNSDDVDTAIMEIVPKRLFTRFLSIAWRYPATPTTLRTPIIPNTPSISTIERPFSCFKFCFI